MTASSRLAFIQADSDPVPALAVVTTYADLRAAIATRRKELNIQQRALDELTGLQGGYTGKLEAGIRNFGPMSFGVTLAALGLALVVIRRPPQKIVGAYAAERQRRIAGWKAAKARNDARIARRKAASAAASEAPDSK